MDCPFKDNKKRKKGCTSWSKEIKKNPCCSGKTILFQYVSNSYAFLTELHQGEAGSAGASSFLCFTDPPEEAESKICRDYQHIGIRLSSLSKLTTITKRSAPETFRRDDSLYQQGQLLSLSAFFKVMTITF